MKDLSHTILKTVNHLSAQGVQLEPWHTSSNSKDTALVTLQDKERVSVAALDTAMEKRKRVCGLASLPRARISVTHFIVLENH